MYVLHDKENYSINDLDVMGRLCLKNVCVNNRSADDKHTVT